MRNHGLQIHYALSKENSLALPSSFPKQSPKPMSSLGFPSTGPVSTLGHASFAPHLRSSTKAKPLPSFLKKPLPPRVLPTSTSARTWTEAKALWTRSRALRWQASSYIPYGHDSLTASCKSQHSADGAYKQPVLADRDSSIQRNPSLLGSRDQWGWLSPRTLTP